MEKALFSGLFSAICRHGAKRFFRLCAWFLIGVFCFFSRPVHAEKMADGFDPPVNPGCIYSISRLSLLSSTRHSDLALEISRAGPLMTLFIALENSLRMS